MQMFRRDRPSRAVRKAQLALDLWHAEAKRAGDRTRTDEYQRLSQNVSDARRADDAARQQH